MPESDQNYMEGVNSARQRLRAARRQRSSDAIDPLESAATMDRLRGVDVGSAGFTGVTDTPAVDVVGAVASTGRSKAPVTTAGWRNREARRGDGYAVPRSMATSTVVTGGCKDGQCGPLRSGTIVGQPVFREMTTYSSPAPQITTTTVGSAPSQATTVQAQAKPADYLDLARQATEFMQGTDPAADPTRVRTYATAAEQFGELSAISEAQKVGDATRRWGDQAAANDALESAAAARKTHAEASAVESVTPDKFAETRTQLVADAVKNGTSPVEFADKVMAQRGLTYQVQDGQKTTTLTTNKLTNEQRDAAREELITEAYGAHGVHLVVQSQRTWKMASGLTAADATADMVGRDPATGSPTSTAPAATPAAQLLSNPSYRRSIDAIVAGFRKQGIMGPDAQWATLNGAVQDYIAPTVQRYMREQFVAANADDIATAKNDQERMGMTKFFEEQGLAEADKYLGALRAELSLINRSLGGEAENSPATLPRKKAEQKSWFGGWPTIDTSAFTGAPAQQPQQEPAARPQSPSQKVLARFGTYPAE